MATAIFEKANLVNDPCVLFQGYYDKKTGYGVKRHNGKLYKAHRLAYIRKHGEIDNKLHVDHICHNEALAEGTCEPGACTHRRCVNPNHLRAVTASENFRAGGNGLENKTHCKRGHLLSEVGIWQWKNSRSCAKCRKTGIDNAYKAFEERKRNK